MLSWVEGRYLAESDFRYQKFSRTRLLLPPRQSQEFSKLR
jgi:hypothetical protein